MRLNDLARWCAKVQISDDGCWLWTGCKQPRGYGDFYFNGRTARAHGVAYEWFVGPVAEGLELDHLCRVTSCVNPAHLEAVTHAENVRRGRGGENWRVRTHCNNGHPFEGDNLLLVRYRNGSGFYRRCRTCSQERSRLWEIRRPPRIRNRKKNETTGPGAAGSRYRLTQISAEPTAGSTNGAARVPCPDGASMPASVVRADAPATVPPLAVPVAGAIQLSLEDAA